MFVTFVTKASSCPVVLVSLLEDWHC